MNNITRLPIEYTKRHAIEAYCIKNIGARKFHIHNQIGGVGWAIRHSASRAAKTIWVVECSEEHAVIIALKYGIV